MLVSEITQWMLVFARIGALLLVLPMFSMQNFPGHLRVLLSAMLAVLLSPFVPIMPFERCSTWTLIQVMAMEVSVGLLLGFVCRLIFFALETSGSLIATEMGLTMASEFNQFSNATTPVPSTILAWMAMMLWFNLDLHHWMIAALQRSYALVPMGGAHLSEALLLDVVRKTGTLFAVAVQIAAPIIGVSFVLSLVFALLARAVPQMNVFSESFPVRTLVGCSIFGSTCLFMAQHIITYLRRLPEDTLRVTQLLGSG